MNKEQQKQYDFILEKIHFASVCNLESFMIEMYATTRRRRGTIIELVRSLVSKQKEASANTKLLVDLLLDALNENNYVAFRDIFREMMHLTVTNLIEHCDDTEVLQNIRDYLTKENSEINT